jgi:hypothetical protein
LYLIIKATFIAQLFNLSLNTNISFNMVETTAPLSVASVLKVMASSLPKETSPQIKSAYDAIALAVHACLHSVGFRLVAVSEDGSMGNILHAFLETYKSNQILEELIEESNTTSTLPPSWNFSQNITFRYDHPQSDKQVIVKVGRLGNNAVVDAIALGDNQRASFDVSVAEYISASSLPYSPVTSDSASDSPSVLNGIQGIFVSAGRLRNLAALVKTNIIQKIVTGTGEVAEEQPGVSRTAAGLSSSEQPLPTADGPRVPPSTGPIPAYNPNVPDAPAARPRVPAAGEQPPGFEDEYDIYRQPRNPLSIGNDDLYPQGLGPNDPFRPHLGPGGIRQPGSGGGMHPTFDDPLFGGEEGQPGGPQNPPGARYDPTFPGDPQGGPGAWPGAGHRGPGGRGGWGGFSGRDFI